MNYCYLNINGTIRVDASLPLAETAIALGQALGISFQRDPDGTFDEFSSFTGTAAGLSFSLLGIPPWPLQVTREPILDYELQISLQERADTAIEPCDCSLFFVNLIRRTTNLVVY